MVTSSGKAVVWPFRVLGSEILGIDFACQRLSSRVTLDVIKEQLIPAKLNAIACE